MQYYFILALQIACAYHIYKSRNHHYWYWVVFLVPALGSAAYILTQVFNKNDVKVVQNELNTVFNPTKKVRDLEKQVAFADTFQNRINLADGYLEMSAFAKAISTYEKALEGSHAKDYYGNSQLLQAYYLDEQFEKVVATADLIQGKSDFEGSKSQFLCGLSYSKLGDVARATPILKKIDQRYSNYKERLVLAQFYLDNNQWNQGKEILSEMIAEHEHMTKTNKRLYRDTFSEVRKLHATLS